MAQLNIDRFDDMPSQVQFLSILKNRSPKLFLEHESVYKRLTADEMGEQEVLRYLHDYGEPHWQVVQNYWSDTNGVSEADLILLTSVGCYVLEVKNYRGKFEYTDGKTTIDGYEYSSDCIFQARRSYKNIRKILSGSVHPQNIHGALIFIGEHNEVTIHSQVDDLQIVQRHQLMAFIHQIAEAERASTFNKLNMPRIERQLKKFQVANPFSMEPLTLEQMHHVKTGITCAQCSSLDTRVTRKFVLCSCGYKELRESATLRTIEEYRVLRHDQQLRVGELYHFMGELNSKRYIYTVLAAHYTMVKNGKYTYYI